MWKFSVLLSVYYFFDITESTNITLDNLVWKVGSSVDVTVGPEDAEYCSVRDDRFQPVSEGPGPCRIVVDRVTVYHNGQWSVFFDMADTDVFYNTTFDVQVIGDEYSGALPVLAWEGEALTMSCPAGTPIRYCYIIAPNGTVFNAGPSISSPHYEYVGSGFDAGDCGIRFNNFRRSDGGGWTCHVGLQYAIDAEEYWTFCFVYVDDRVVKSYAWLFAAIPCLLLIFASFLLVLKNSCKWTYARVAIASEDDHLPSRLI